MLSSDRTENDPSHTLTVIIDFLYENEEFSPNVIRLAKKYSPKKIELINGKDFLIQVMDRDFKPLISENRIRIYIVGHCLPGEDFLYGANESEISHRDLAQSLARYIGDNANVNVNLVACYAGADSKNGAKDSYGAKLHRELVKEKNRDIPVVARNQSVNIVEGVIRGTTKTKTYKTTNPSHLTADDITLLVEKRDAAPLGSMEREKLDKQLISLDRWQQFGSKVIFMLDDSKNQICVDAYDHYWKLEVLTLIDEAQSKSQNDKTNEILEEWQSTFTKLSSEDISRRIKNELDKPLLILKHTSPFSYFYNFFNKETNVFVKLKELIEARESMQVEKKSPPIHKFK